MYNGLGMNAGSLSRLSNAKTRSISAENFTGESGGGAKAIPSDDKYTGSGASKELGLGWKVSPSVLIQPGVVFTIADIEGPGAIQSIWCAGDLNYDLIIRIYWDGQENPSVEAPLPAFFAHAYCSESNCNGRYPTLDSAIVMVAPKRGFSCFWEMPFHKHCRITIENLSTKGKYFYYQINYTLTEIPEDCAYFHAQYRQRRPVGYMEEFVILDGVKGKGQYVGTSMAVGLNGANGWWGEGEMKFYMDGDNEFPTICGTGIEDYFLGAWGWESEGKFVPYSGLYAGMYQVDRCENVYTSQQRFQLYRWHVPDPIRFDHDLKVTVQDLGWRSEGRYLPRRDDFMTVAYWYQTLPTAPFPELPSERELEIV